MIFCFFKTLVRCAPLALVFLGAAVRLGAGAPQSYGFPLASDAEARITITPVSQRWDGSGFMPVRVRLENSADRPRVWTLRFFVHRGYSGEVVTFETPISAEARGEANTVVFVPGGAVEPRGMAYLRIEADGPGARRANIQPVYPASEPLVITATPPSMETSLFATINGVPGVKTEISAMTPENWPADWRVWAPFKRVVLTAADHAALDGARRAALRDWVALGGTLDLYPAEAGAHAGTEPIGHGAIRYHAKPLKSEAPAQVFLHDGLSGGPSATVINETRRRELTPGTGALGLSLFLLGFGVLVGPVNLFVFAPAQRRQRLFFTVPLISVAASVLMAGYIVLKDGFGGAGAQRGLVVLLPESNQAVVAQSQVALTGVLMGGDFALPGDVAMAQVTADSGDFMGSGSRRGAEFDRTTDSAAGDWFTSRRVQEQALRRLVPTRARVELVGGGEAGAPPVVQSSVGGTLKDFVYLDAYGVRWVAAEVPPGRRVTLGVPPDNFVASVPRGWFVAKGGAAEGLAPIATLDSIRWDDPEFTYAGPLVGARTP